MFQFPPPSHPPSQDAKPAEAKTTNVIHTQPDTASSFPKRSEPIMQPSNRRNNLHQFLEEAEEVVGEYQTACSQEFQVLMEEIEALKERYYAKVSLLLSGPHTLDWEAYYRKGFKDACIEDSIQCPSTVIPSARITTVPFTT